MSVGSFFKLSAGANSGRSCACLALPSDEAYAGRRAAGIDAIHQRFRNRVSVIAEVVLDVGAGVANVVGPDGAAVLEMNDFRGRAQHSRGQQESGNEGVDDRRTH